MGHCIWKFMLTLCIRPDMSLECGSRWLGGCCWCGATCLAIISHFHNSPSVCSFSCSRVIAIRLLNPWLSPLRRLCCAFFNETSAFVYTANVSDQLSRQINRPCNCPPTLLPLPPPPLLPLTTVQCHCQHYTECAFSGLPAQRVFFIFSALCIQ